MASLAQYDLRERPLTDPLDRLMGYQLRRASAWILADLGRRLTDLDLRPTEASIILLIGANTDITQSDIGRILGIKRANMAPLAATLATRGLIGKTRADGRSQALHLTAEGTTLVSEIEKRIVAHEAHFLQELSPEERTALAARIRRIWRP